MCGRYTITANLAELEKLARFICKVVDFKPRYNLAPRALAPVLVWENGQPVLKPMRWGLIPPWAKDETIGDKLINAHVVAITDKSYRAKEVGDQLRKPRKAENPTNRRSEWLAIRFSST